MGVPFITSDSSASELERRDDTARDNAASTDVLDTDAAELGPSGISADELATTLDVLARGEAAPGHVVNLGHGVPPDTDPGVLTALVERIHAA